MIDIKKKIICAISFLAIFIFWFNIGDSISASAERIEVISEPVPINPKVQWWQIDDGSFKAQNYSGTISSPNESKDKNNPYPAAKTIQARLDLNNYKMPDVFKEANGKKHNASEVIDKEAMNPEWDLESEGKNYGGISKSIWMKTTLEIYVETGGKYKYTDYVEYGKNPHGDPKYNITYPVPMYITWKGYIETGGNENGGGDPTGDVCPIPKEVPKRYEHELDLIVSRLDARTVDIDTNTKTDVYVERADFSGSREQAKQEFNDYIEDTKAKKADCEALIQKWEAEKAALEAKKSSLESEYSSCLNSGWYDDDGRYHSPSCGGYSSQISSVQSEISTVTAKISKGKATMPVYDEKIKLAQDELNYIKSNESKYQTVQPTVDLKYDGSAVSQITVSLTEGQKQRYSFPIWKVTQQGKDIMAQINSNGPYQEFKYTDLKGRQQQSLGYNTALGHVLYSDTSSNNWKDTGQYVATYQGASCPAFESDQYFKTQTVQDIVRTVNENGNKRNIYENLTTNFTKLPREKMRAGYGFEYVITSVYKNNDTEPEPANATGTKEVESYFPTLVDYQPYKRGGARTGFDLYGNVIPYGGIDEGYLVQMETSSASAPRDETKNWILPPVAIEEYSGNIFTMNNNDHKYHEKRNLNETLLTTDKKRNPFHKWYTNFTDPDGDYDFRVRTFDAGVNHLNTCHNGRVLVEGTVIGDPNGNDDYVKRAVTPENPFPAGVGWNWDGKVNQITNLLDWYMNWYPKPSQVPVSQYRRTFYLSPNTLKEINDYTQKNPEIILGESIFDKINIPETKK
ncbi:hypothetical protein P4562_21220 [Lysinibacillus xylanilyticus]|uniref:hypothetical protein n=1 Tax=Lysinibacillus xylanilyticus TaxID=582475 RepID=UPI002E206FF9|nr:hypothetical protein [Lysinibacillus xylanilyticus]